MKDFTMSIMSCTNIAQLEENVLNTLQNTEKIKCTKNKNRAIAIAMEKFQLHFSNDSKVLTLLSVINNFHAACTHVIIKLGKRKNTWIWLILSPILWRQFFLKIQRNCAEIAGEQEENE